jgi:nucleotide-binding universal stress UspA family protein
MSDLIVCGTDFSPQAEAALAWAAAVAGRSGGHIDLVHVAPAPNADARLLMFDTMLFDAKTYELAAERLQGAATTAARTLGVSVRPRMLRGTPHEAIVKYAREQDARMVVLGACGLAAVERLMFGSVAARTVRAADRTVVLVPCPPEPRQWGAGSAGRPPKVVVGVGTGDEIEALRLLAYLRREAPTDVTFIHLYWPIGEYQRLGLRGPRDVFAPDPEVVRNLEPGLRAKLSTLAGQGAMTLEILPEWGDPASNLLVALDENDADLLVVGAHERHGLSRLLGGSMGRRLARQSRYVPVAVVPSPTREPARPAGIPQVQSVLATTDLSPLGNAGVAHAYSLLRGTGGVVELCYVHEHALPSPAYGYDLPERKLTVIERDRLLKELRELVPADAEAIGITTHVTVLEGGKASEAIVQASERLNVDVVCLASHGRGGLARAVLGSVAQEVVRAAHRPVLVVRSK